MTNGNASFVGCRTIAPQLSGNRVRVGRCKSRSADIPISSLPERFDVARIDRRIQRTRALLHEALGSLIRERAYDRITVAQILKRAKVSRSTFYTHFRDKDELLISSMRAFLCGTLSIEARAPTDTAERMVAFSLPLLAHIHQHRRSARVRLGDRGRSVLHEHLRRLLSEWIAQTLQVAAQWRRSRRMPVAPELLAQHIASTFVLVLHWWLDHGGSTSPVEANNQFRALVMPVLASARP